MLTRVGKTLNAGYMEAAAAKAREGLLMAASTNLLPPVELYRFANSQRPDLYFSGPWWLSFSPYHALVKYAALRDQSLSLAARTCLAIDWGWSNVDVLVRVRPKVRLSAWSGTPKTQVLKEGSQETGFRYTGARWEPDRDITQLYIPGLGEPDPGNPHWKIWQSAFIVECCVSL